MEGKGNVVLGVLILCLVVAQTQVEAIRCCKNPLGSACYVACSKTLVSYVVDCEEKCECRSGFEKDRICPNGYDYPTIPFLTNIENSAGDTINEFCKLGCASSECNAISTLKISDAGEEVVNEAMRKCNNACSAFCTKGSTRLFSFCVCVCVVEGCSCIYLLLGINYLK
ncbi:Thionin [Thalictrum thalictroides]|uniref:Thionin n=1 Tax=Thalictrum thalictroides TaxID=46969 RepID=A0A7J6WG43_THATH|nr:Thionin [Thalictrum thalictroides]